MSVKSKKQVPDTPHLFDRVRDILESARSNIARTVNTTQVIANWLIGREIVEEEQQGKRRAGYGAELLRELSTRLKADFGSGYGVDNLELFRRFYLEYPQLLPKVNSDAVRRKSAPADNSETVRRNLGVSEEDSAAHIANAVRSDSWQPGRLNPNLSWTHYRPLGEKPRQERVDAFGGSRAGSCTSDRCTERPGGIGVS